MAAIAGMDDEAEIMAGGGQLFGRIDVRASASSDAAAVQASADSVLANTLSSCTVGIYTNHIKHMKEWARGNHNTDEIFEANGELRVPMCSDLVNNYLGHLNLRRVEVKKKSAVAVGGVTKEKQLAVSYITGVTSAISWYHTSQKQQVRGDVILIMTNFKKGYKRAIAQQKFEGMYPMLEGKNHLSFEGYEVLADTALRLKPEGPGGSWSQGLFFWPYLLLLWGTIARVASVGLLMLQHISIKNGAISVKIPKAKCDQDGESCFEKHMFANPKKPSQCVVLALAVRVFTMKLAGDFRLFEGLEPQRRFCDILSVVIGKIDGMRKWLFEDIGAHSVKKGACTFLNSILGGPNVHAVELRADHAIGDVRSRYIFQSPAQDMFIGRLLAGLPMQDIDFSLKMPEFTQAPVIDWDTILPEHKNLPVNFQPVIPALLASLVYHAQWLRSNLDPNHPLLMSHLFTSGQVESLFPHVSVAHDPHGGGIPGSVQDHALLVKMPEAVAQTMAERFTIAGVAPLTPASVSDIVVSAVATALKQAGVRSSNASDAVTRPHRMHLWPSTEGFHRVPHTWTLLAMSCKALWRMWVRGNSAEGVMPYRCIKQHDLPRFDVAKFNKQRILLSKFRGVGTFLEGHCGVEASNISNLEDSQLQAAFDEAWSSVTEFWGQAHEDLSFSTIYDHLPK